MRSSFALSWMRTAIGVHFEVVTHASQPPASGSQGLIQLVTHHQHACGQMHPHATTLVNLRRTTCPLSASRSTSRGCGCGACRHGQGRAGRIRRTRRSGSTACLYNSCASSQRSAFLAAGHWHVPPEEQPLQTIVRMAQSAEAI
ncbi:hypothetical protein BKA62DRAFT_717658 [Auriculariales sp. MPI-PUGE-AT-0066]|nr:hypothetical protein BKA62DRAFT_717658 [Auriculariales sp. MPI-PUGE-AT-0066]